MKSTYIIYFMQNKPAWIYCMVCIILMTLYGCKNENNYKVKNDGIPVKIETTFYEYEIDAKPNVRGVDEKEVEIIPDNLPEQKSSENNIKSRESDNNKNNNKAEPEIIAENNVSSEDVIIKEPVINEVDESKILLQQARNNKDNYKYETALNVYKQILEADKNNFEAIYSISFLYSELGFQYNDNTGYYRKGKEYADKAMAMNPSHPESNFVMAVALGRMASVSRLRDKINYLRPIKNHIDITLKADPTHHRAWFLLGIWNYEISNLNAVETAAARVALGSEINNASMDNAAMAFDRAVKINPSSVVYNYYFGLALLQLNHTDKAKYHLMKTVNLPARSKGDPGHQQGAMEALRKLG